MLYLLRWEGELLTYITRLEIGFLGTDEERRVSNGSVSVLHLLVL